MTDDTGSRPADDPPRQLACACCGVVFECRLDGTCWCAGEPVRLPMPDESQQPVSDCICPTCLRTRARPATEGPP